MKPVSSNTPTQTVKNQPDQAANAYKDRGHIGATATDQVVPGQAEARAKLARLMGVSLGGLQQFHQARQAALVAPAPASPKDEGDAAISPELKTMRLAYQAALQKTQE